MRRLLIVAALLSHTGSARADRTWAVGVTMTTLGSPQGHLGIPLAGDHLAPSVYGQRELDDHFSLAADLGLPTATGLALGLGGEYRYALTGFIDAFCGVSLQGGFAGPDYYARRDNEFVGYTYAVKGTPMLGVRGAVGLRFHLLSDRFEVGLGAFDAIIRPISPHGDATFDNLLSAEVSVGVRF